MKPKKRLAVNKGLPRNPAERMRGKEEERPHEGRDDEVMLVGLLPAFACRGRGSDGQMKRGTVADAALCRCDSD